MNLRLDEHGVIMDIANIVLGNMDQQGNPREDRVSPEVAKKKLNCVTHSLQCEDMTLGGRSKAT